VDVRPDKVVVLADTAESSFRIDAEKAEAARARAAKLLESGVPGEVNRNAALELRRAEMALKLSRRVGAGSSAGKVRILDDDDK
jgi:F0F1-type ATP synthase epsilon subunit